MEGNKLLSFSGRRSPSKMYCTQSAGECRRHHGAGCGTLARYASSRSHQRRAVRTRAPSANLRTFVRPRRTRSGRPKSGLKTPPAFANA